MDLPSPTDLISTSTLLTPAGIGPSHRLHPEIGEVDFRILRRDLKLRRKHRTRSFLRDPYQDLDEPRLLQFMGKEAGKPVGVVAAVAVIALGSDTNARRPIPPEQLQEKLDDPGYLDLRHRRKGFG